MTDKRREELKKSITATRAYYGVMNLPLTYNEGYGWLWQPPANVTFEEYLGFLPEAGFNTTSSAFLVDGVTTPAQTERLRHRAAGLMRFIAWVPFFRAAFVCNSVGAEQAHVGSDIDLLVIAAPGRIWTVRFFLNLITRALGIRTYQHQEAGKLCLSFFADADHLDFSSLRLRDDDVHFIYWLNQMMPVYDEDSWFEGFYEANAWVRNFLPHMSSKRAQHFLPQPYRFGKILRVLKRGLEKIFAGRCGAWLENKLERVQRRILSPELLAKADDPKSGVVISSGVLKFHSGDTREKIYAAWKEKMAG